MTKMYARSMAALMALVVVAFAGAAQAVGTGSLSLPSGWYPAGTNLTVDASVGANSAFGGWLGETNGMSITGPQIQFTVSGPRSVTGLFSHIQHDITATAGLNGSISPNGTVPVLQTSNQTFTITADSNYHIADVVVDTVSQGAIGSYTFTNVMAAHDIDASFAIDTFTVVFDLGGTGTRTGGGALTQTVDYASAATAPTVTPDTGLNFTGWDKSFASVTSNMTVNAQYSVVQYTVTYLSDANGTISGTATQTVSHGNDGSQVTAAANTGYHFVDWSDNVLTAARTDTGVTNDITVTANFAINQYTFTVTSAHGTADPANVTTSDWNTAVNAAIIDSPVELSGTTQYVATGWIGTGSLASGSGTNTSFTITNNTTVTWQWQTNYWIEFQTTGN